MSSSDDDSDSSYDYALGLEVLNISNDQYYQPVERAHTQSKVPGEGLDIPKYGSPTIIHSLPAYDLWRLLFPTYLSEEKFKNFHRPKLRHYNTGPQALKRFRRLRPFPIKNLSRNIYQRQKKLRNSVVSAINKGSSREEVAQSLLIRDAKELTAKHGELFLFEYCEEYPPVLSQVGMATNIKNYRYRCTSSQLATKVSAIKRIGVTGESSQVPPEAAGDTNASTNIPQPRSCQKIGYDQIVPDNFKTKPIYFNQPEPGSEVQVIENNLYRAPIYAQEVPHTDFLVIRTRQSLYIRGIRNIFTVGQTMPLVTIPQPNTSTITKFRSELSNTWIHKLFMSSQTDPPTLDLNLLAKLFPDYHSSILNKRMRSKGVRFKETRQTKLALKGDSKYGDLTVMQHRLSFTPERYCINMAMLAARQRLRELNYSESMIDPPEAVELETEVLAAPWNTSKAVQDAIAKKCYLDLKRHLIDPTGSQQEGFSCVHWTRSPTEDAQTKEQQSQNRIKNPGTFSAKNPLATKIQREKLERMAIFQREANQIARVQSSVLSSREALSSEDESGNDEPIEEDKLNDSFDEQLRDLDRLVLGGRTETELHFEKEEEIRLQMQKEFMQNGFSEGGDQNTQDPPVKSPIKSNNRHINVSAFKNRALKITRTYNTYEGKIHRTEIVREPKVIALYVKLKGGTGFSPTETENNQNSGNVMLTSTPNGKHQDSQQPRRESLGLQPDEICRADGLKLRISKRVLDDSHSRRMRKERRTRIRFAEEPVVQTVDID